MFLFYLLAHAREFERESDERPDGKALVACESNPVQATAPVMDGASALLMHVVVTQN